MKFRTVFAVAAIAAGVVFSCSKDESAPGNDQGGTAGLTIKLTDGPGNYDAVNINIREVEVISATAGTVKLEGNPGMYNLLDYSNGKDTVIATGGLKAGVISQIRLILGDGNNVVVDGVTYDLATPSAQESGLKLQLHDSLVAGVQYALLLDFDASKSIVQQGNGNYLLKPVIRVIDSAVSGAITGVVSPATAHVLVTAESGNESYSTYTNADGAFLLQGIPEGTYNIYITKDDDEPIVITNVTVTIGQNTNLQEIDL